VDSANPFVEFFRTEHLQAHRDNAARPQRQGRGLRAVPYPAQTFPKCPFDIYREAERQKFLPELPLQCLDLPAPFFVVEA
jgi:hypothetical protein